MGKMYYRCKVCGVKFEEHSSLEVHGWTHDEERPSYSRNDCGVKCVEISSSSADLVDEETEVRHRCDVCGVKFEDCFSLEMHERTHDEEKFLLKRNVDVKLGEIPSPSPDEMDEDRKVPYRCDVCGVKFEEYSSLEVHERSHNAEKSAYERDDCVVKFAEISSSSTDGRDEQRLYSCDVCGVNFGERTSFQVHKNTHSVNGLAFHWIQTGERPFKCNICDERFALSSNLVSHIQTHIEKRPFGCDVCGKRFTESVQLESHQLMHAEEKLFKCDICSESFTHYNELAPHKRTHREERPYQCGVCDKRFTLRDTLVRHQRTHTGERPFKCDVCGKRFTESGHLVSHTRTHTGERPFKCDVCGKDFTRSNHLVRHKRTHTGERLFKCDVCDKTFTQSSNLLRHERTHIVYRGNAVQVELPVLKGLNHI